MPVLKDFRQTREVVLPSYPDSKVLIYDSMLVGDIAAFSEDPKNLEQALPALLKLVQSWNFTDETGKPMPIDEASVKLLKASDVTYLFEQIKEFAVDVKKV